MKNKNYLLISILLLLFIADNIKASPSSSLKNLVEERKEEVIKFFEKMDLDIKGMDGVKNAVEQQDYALAAHQLLLYYKNKPQDFQFDFPEYFIYTEDDARKALEDSVMNQSKEGKLGRTEKGMIDWHDKGPLNDVEWAFFVNRHYFLNTLLTGYQKAGDERYVKKINKDLKDWLISNPKPDQEVNLPPWRPTETAIRFDTWPKIFYLLMNDEYFEDDTRMLMLMSIYDHAEYLQKYHHKNHNHASIQMNGLCIISSYWPEFKKSEEWYQHALKQQLEEINYQVLPDGVQNELSAGYHWSVLRLFQTFIVAANEGGRTVPPIFKETIEKMYNYMAYSATPYGTSPMNGDTDIKYIENVVRKAAAFYDRPDWTYIITNGQEGIEPQGYPSRVFPYAGKVISRSGYDKEILWSIFDSGPWGASHQHNDKLHLSVAAFGRPLLVDAGRLWYKSDIKRQYFIGSYSHNVILVDGKQQNSDVKYFETDDQFSYQVSDKYTYAQATFDKSFIGLSDSVVHSRGVCFLDNSLWLVIDEVKTNRPHSISPLWHFHPDCHVVKSNDNIYSNDQGKGNLLIKTIGDIIWQIDLEKGQEKRKVEEEFYPFNAEYADDFPLQGWYSETYNKIVPNYAAVYNANITEDQVFGWLLFPFRGENLPQVKVSMTKKGEIITINVRTPDKSYTVHINWLEAKCQVR